MTTRKATKVRSAGEELGLKLLDSVRQMKARNFARATEVAVNEVVEARQSTGMSQSEFASALSISKRTLQEWEQGRRSPSGAAQALIRIARKHPRSSARRAGMNAAGSNPSLKLSPNGMSRWPSSAGPSAHFALTVQRAMPSVPA